MERYDDKGESVCGSFSLALIKLNGQYQAICFASLVKNFKKIKPFDCIRYQRRGNSAHEELRQMKGFVQRTISRVFNGYHFGQTETKRIQEGNFTGKQQCGFGFHLSEC